MAIFQKLADGLNWPCQRTGYRTLNKDYFNDMKTLISFCVLDFSYSSIFCFNWGQILFGTTRNRRQWNQRPSFLWPFNLISFIPKTYNKHTLFFEIDTSTTDISPFLWFSFYYCCLRSYTHFYLYLSNRKCFDLTQA